MVTKGVPASTGISLSRAAVFKRRHNTSGDQINGVDVSFDPLEATGEILYNLVTMDRVHGGPRAPKTLCCTHTTNGRSETC